VAVVPLAGRLFPKAHAAYTYFSEDRPEIGLFIGSQSAHRLDGNKMTETPNSTELATASARLQEEIRRALELMAYVKTARHVQTAKESHETAGNTYVLPAPLV